MQGKQTMDGVRRVGGLSVATDSISSGPLTSSPDVQTVPQAPAPLGQQSTPPLQQARVFPIWVWLVVLLILVLAGIGSFFLFRSYNQPNQEFSAGNLPITKIPLGELASSASPGSAESLRVNGQLQVSDSLVLAPSLQPSNPILGQIYLDTNTNKLAYYNGESFVELGGNTTNVTNTTTTNSAVTNVSNPTNNGIELQAAAPGTPQTGNFNVAGTGTVGVLASNTIQGTGTGAFSISTPQASGLSSTVTIKTGDSSTTAAGNLTIDTGSSIIDGDVVAHKTFETSNDVMTPWFNTNLTRSTAQAHTGSYSLAETGTAANWGVIEQLPGTAVVPGHQYYFSIWVRADSVPRSIGASVAWVGASSPVTLSPVTDSTSEWREITGLAVAPAGATSAYFRLQGVGAAGETHYFDDITITDLSSSSAIASLDIGATNAKKITIGNVNQIGATSIFGGSGINLNSGAGTTTISAGALNASAASNSTIQTSSGALTLTSADTTLWGVAASTTGVGGDLTLRAGNGSAGGDNDGGDLILQGGNANAAGISGHVVVRPQSDSTDIFQIQNSTSTPLFIADSTNMRLTVTGTNTTFATLTLTDSHFRSTQTTAPAVAAPTNCGTGSTAAMAPGSTDSAGSFTITTGSGGTSSSCDTTITFQRPYATAPKTILVTGKATASSVARQPYVINETAAGFTVSFATSTGGANAAPYQFSYWVVE